MKPLWTHTLAWIAAILAALLLALAGPEAGGNGFELEVAHGAGTPR
ncbi:MAG: hypothetical protein JWP65_1269 [Ramlibacter sp.]|jgi:hypothetical protein|nr:hypothetical protein [Ramlibacter sp.]MDB5750848.1 hypothetical protein [Ramlibacter sp.]